MERCDFLPVSAEEMHERGWWWYDALVVGGDAYVDHPSFGTAVPLSETIQGFKEIIAGKYDDIPESYFLMAGNIDDVLAKVK